MLTLLALLMLVPIEMALQRSQRFQMLPPIEQNIQRASHGAAFVVILLLLGFVLYGIGPGKIGDDTRMLIADPQDHWALVAALVLFAYGAVRFVVGARRVWGARDGLRAARAVVKIGIGGILLFSPWHADSPWIGSGEIVVGLWLFITGI